MTLRGGSLRRKTTFFEKVLLVVGILIVVLGYALIQKMASFEGAVLSWNVVSNVFLWLFVVLMVVMLAVQENVKEELKEVITNQTEEMKLLKQEIRFIRRR